MGKTCGEASYLEFKQMVLGRVHVHCVNSAGFDTLAEIRENVIPR